MSDASLIRQMQKQLAEAEAERLRPVEQLTKEIERSAMEIRNSKRAALEEREACAQLVDSAYEWEDATDLAAQIRARGDK